MKLSSFGHSSESLLAAIIVSCACEIFVQPSLAQNSEPESGEIALQKTVETREYNGQTVEGQERLVRPGDSLWRMLILENSLPEKRFGQYLNLVRRLNPQLKTADVLRVGERIFVPLRPDEVLGYQAAPVKAESSRPRSGTTQNYAVKPGDHLAKVLKEQLKITDDKTVALYYNLTKDLNSQKKNWDLLQPGEIIRLPVLDAAESMTVANRTTTPIDKKAGSTVSSPSAPVVTAESKSVSEAPPAVAPSVSLDYTRQAARENVLLIGEVVASLGNEIQRSGEEVVSIKDGSLRFERNSFPVVYNRNLSQKILLDPEEKIPDSLRTQLNDKMNGAAVVTIGKSSSVQEAVSQVLARLGFQALPMQKTVVIQEGGVAFEAKGQWVVLAPEENNKPQDVYVINVSDKAAAVPEYLKAHLALKGLHLRDIVWPPSSNIKMVRDPEVPRALIAQAKRLPRDKQGIVDALLLSYGIPFGVKVGLSWELGQGLKVETACDRVFEWRGQQTAVFFQRVGSEMKKSLQEKQAMKIVELDLASLSSRDLVGKLLDELGEPAAYREQRFPAASGSMQEKFTVITSGFLLQKRSVFMTDREVPEQFRRFFFEKGLEIVYFQ